MRNAKETGALASSWTSVSSPVCWHAVSGHKGQSHRHSSSGGALAFVGSRRDRDRDRDRELRDPRDRKYARD